jgi:hypothetical protein
VEKAYIILAHKNVAFLIRLIDRLDDGFSHFFIHFDLNSAIEKEKISIKDKTNVTFIKSIKTPWGSFGLVAATLNAMAAIKESGIAFERVILISGQDYPVKSNDYINNFLKQSSRSIFITYSSLPNYEKWPDGGGLYRINKYFFGFSFFQKYTARIINLACTFFKILQRNLKSNMVHYYGSQWWIIDYYAMNYILEFIQKNPKYTSFHQYTFAPDELFFQTILLNSNDEIIKGNILNDNKIYTRWKSIKSPHPEVLIEENFNDIYYSSALFARKFDPAKDTALLSMIDKKCLFINK